MLTQELIRYKRKVVKVKGQGKGGKQQFRAGSEDHRVFVLNGTLAAIYNQGYQAGSCVVVRDSRLDGIILNIHEDVKGCVWDGLKPRCLEVYTYADNDINFYHPSDLEFL